MKVDAQGNLYWPEGVQDKLRAGTFNDVTGNTDWNSLLFHKYAPMMTHNVSISGGGRNTHYFMSARYYKLGGIYKTDISNNERLNARVHVDHYFDKIGLRLDGDVSFSQNRTKYPPNGLYLDTRSTPELAATLLQQAGTCYRRTGESVRGNRPDGRLSQGRRSLYQLDACCIMERA